MSRHPELNDGITRLLASLRPMMQRGALEGVAVVLMDEQHAAQPPASGAAAATATGDPLRQGVEQYTFWIDLQSQQEMPATYSDLETMFASALTQLLSHESTRPRVSSKCTWTVLIQSHETLAGPHDAQARRDLLPSGAGSSHQYGGAGAGSSSGGLGLGAAAAVDGILGGESGWVRVGPGDRSAAATAAAAAVAFPRVSVSPGIDIHNNDNSGGNGIRSYPMKSIRAGSLSIQVSHDKPS